MSAILAVLLEEYDLETRTISKEFTQLGEYTEMELVRVHTFGAVCLRKRYCCAGTDMTKKDRGAFRRSSPSTSIPARPP
jgi:hypothetical protein